MAAPVAVVVAAIIIVAAATLAATRLEFAMVAEIVVSSDAGRALAIVPTRTGRFAHVFVHSFHLTPVEEWFRIESPSAHRTLLRLFELRYESLGVGMPVEPEGGLRLVDGKFVLAMDRSFEKIPIFVSIVPGHGLLVDGEYLPFRNWAGPERRVILSGRTVIKLRWRR